MAFTSSASLQVFTYTLANCTLSNHKTITDKVKGFKQHVTYTCYSNVRASVQSSSWHVGQFECV